MAYALQVSQYGLVAPLFEPYLCEPLLWAVLEGRRDARVWVDDASAPQAALVWSETECGYVVGGWSATATLKPMAGAHGGCLRGPLTITEDRASRRWSALR
jgi:hypothetical protein